MRNLHRRGDLIALGIALGLSYQTVLGMGNGDDFLSQIIAAWLTHQDNVLSQCGEPTWSVLADKLEEIGCSEIAGDIQRKHDGPQHGGESEQQESSSSVLSADASNSLMDDQLNSTSLLDAPCNSYETITPISMLQPVIESTQDQARNIIGYVAELNHTSKFR